jgi:hypothetical protein
VEEHDDRHHFRQAEASGAVALALSRREQSLFPEWFKELTEIVMSQKTGRISIERASFVLMGVLANSILRNLALSAHS